MELQRTRLPILVCEKGPPPRAGLLLTLGWQRPGEGRQDKSWLLSKVYIKRHFLLGDVKSKSLMSQGKGGEEAGLCSRETDLSGL